MWIYTVVDLENGQKLTFGRIVAATVLHNNNVVNMKKALLGNEDI
jgi:hypothetical protein